MARTREGVVDLCHVFPWLVLFTLGCWFCILPAAHGFQPLAEPILKDLDTPEDVAVTAAGEILVAEAGAHRVLLADRQGEVLLDIPLASPTAVAVDLDGTLLVAASDGGVRRYATDGTFLGWLAGGPGTFRLVRNLAVDPATGMVLVVDQLAGRILGYTGADTPVLTIDDQDNLPVDVAVVGEEIFVLDQPLDYDCGARPRRARILICDRAGTPKAEFGGFGAGAGKFVSPRGLAVTNDGLLLVSDFYRGAVSVFDIWGNPVDLLADPKVPALAPKGLAVAGDGLVLVASPMSGTVRGFLPAAAE